MELYCGVNILCGFYKSCEKGRTCELACTKEREDQSQHPPEVMVDRPPCFKLRKPDQPKTREFYGR